MSRRLVREFRALKPNEPWAGEESAKEHFYVWRKIRKNVQETEDTVSSPGADDQAEEHENIPEIEISGSPVSSREQPTPSPIYPLLQGTYLTGFRPGPSNQQPEEKEVTLPQQNNLTATPPKAKGTSKQQDPKPGSSKLPISTAFSNAILWPTESPIKNDEKKSHQSSDYRMLLVRLSGWSIGMRKKKRRKKRKWAA